MSHMRRTGKRKQYAAAMRAERKEHGRTYRKSRKECKQAKRGLGIFAPNGGKK